MMAAASGGEDAGAGASNIHPTKETGTARQPSIVCRREEFARPGNIPPRVILDPWEE